jgi:hypothetical protein
MTNTFTFLFTNLRKFYYLFIHSEYLFTYFIYLFIYFACDSVIPSTLLSYFLLTSFCFLLFFLLNMHFISLAFYLCLSVCLCVCVCACACLCVCVCLCAHCSVVLIIASIPSVPYTDNPSVLFPSACVFTVPTATILGGPDLHVDKGSTINLTCTIKYSPEPTAYIFWYHHDEVRTELLLGVGWHWVPWYCCSIPVCFSSSRWNAKALEWQVVKENCSTQKTSSVRPISSSQIPQTPWEWARVSVVGSDHLSCGTSIRQNQQSQWQFYEKNETKHMRVCVFMSLVRCRSFCLFATTTN